MNSNVPTHKQLIDAINKLPSEILPELANFLSYLQFKVTAPVESEEPPSGSAFLLSIAGLGESEEDDLSERDEEILTKEIDPIRGWAFGRDNQS